jgi:hypothetical protein
MANVTGKEPFGGSSHDAQTRAHVADDLGVAPPESRFEI